MIATFDGRALDRFWLADYVPELIELERRRFPAIGAICSALGSDVHVAHLSVPVDCLDGFNEAFYARPERFLDEDARGAQSAWALVGPDIEARFVSSLRSDLNSGGVDRRYGEWRSRPAFDGALRLIVGRP